MILLHLATLQTTTAQRPTTYNVNTFHTDLSTATTSESKQALVEKVAKWLGKDFVDKGFAFKQDQLHGVWFFKSTTNATPKLTASDGGINVDMQPLADGVFFYEGYKPDGAGFYYSISNGTVTTPPTLIEFYKNNPEMMPHEGVPKGTLRQMPEFSSRIYAGTKRNWWVYIPAGIKPGDRPAVMVFQDGAGAKNYSSVMMDNLIAKGDIPPMVGIFIDPGHLEGNRSNRSVEYDTVSDTYSKFIIDEILPEVEKIQPLTTDPKMHGVQGASSGGICAFALAYYRPDMFTKVMSWIGSFVNLQPGKTGVEGGHNFPAMIRKFDKKPIRVFLQDGENDLDNPFGNWPLANKYMANSLAFRGWDYKFVLGHGGHNGRHGQSIMPDAMRWLWRDWK